MQQQARIAAVGSFVSKLVAARTRASAPALVVATLLALVVPSVAQDQRAQPQPPTPAELRLDRDIPWIRDPVDLVDRGRGQRPQPDVDRSALLEQALKQAKETGKPVLWYVPRLLDSKYKGRQMYRAPVLDTYAQQVLFADPDVASIVSTRFVPLRLICDGPLSDRYRLRPLPVDGEDTVLFVEPGVVFLDANGEVLHVLERIRTFDAVWFAEVLRNVLAKSNGPVTPGNEIAQGQWEAAAAHLQRIEPRTPRQEYELATLLRRLRQAKSALAALDRAEAAAGAAGDAALQADVATERGLVLALSGRFDEAEPHLRRGFEGKGSRAAEAGYLLALQALRKGHEDDAREGFAAVAERFPDAPYGRKARANVVLGNDRQPLGAAFAGFEHVGWLPPPAYEGLPRDTQWPRQAPLPLAALTHQAVRFLLAQQRDHGGFTDSRYAYWPNPEITPNAWVAITALACTALLAHRDVDPDAIDAALARGERYMFDPARLNRGKNEDVYADAYRLLYLVRKQERLLAADAAAEARAALIGRMNALIREAVTRQTKDGFFAHEYPNAFCTGAMLWSLLLARRAGAEVPEEAMSRALTALESAREASGAFVYGGAAKAAGKTSLKDASARMPLCEGVLLAGERSSPQRVQAAFAAFLEFLDRLERIRRNDFHTDGQLGGFFFFHAVFHASETAALLPEAERRAVHERIVQLLRSIPELDGSFLDSHEIGRSYGTAMALLTIENAVRAGVRGDGAAAPAAAGSGSQPPATGR